MAASATNCSTRAPRRVPTSSPAWSRTWKPQASARCRRTCSTPASSSASPNWTPLSRICCDGSHTLFGREHCAGHPLFLCAKVRENNSAVRNDPRRILILAGWCAFAPLALEAAREPLQDLRWTGSAALWAAAYALREGRRFRQGTPALWSCAAQGAASVVVGITGPRAAHHAALIAVTAAEVADLLAVHLAFAAAGAMSVVALATLLAQRRLQPAHLAAVAAFPLFAAGAATLERR